MKDNMYRTYILMRKLLMVSSILVLASCGGGGGSGSGSGDDGFPTPKLPASAAKFDNTNANTIADSAVGFLRRGDVVTSRHARGSSPHRSSHRRTPPNSGSSLFSGC